MIKRPRLPTLPENFQHWFAARGWSPRAHQLELLALAQRGESALLVAPTGAGKTLAGFLPSLVEIAATKRRDRGRGVHTLYISPLKALAVDVARNLDAPVIDLTCRCASKRALATRPPRAASASGAIRLIS